jgi:release factor glutamine methyltransferase
VNATATAGAAVAAARDALRRAGIDTAALDARLLVSHGLGVAPAHLLGHPEHPLGPGVARRLDRLVARRLAGEPLAYIVGVREFWSLPLSVSPATLIPRPDSETLIETALALFGRRRRGLRVLDLGTGSGCLLLALLHEWPDATGVGVDRSIDALRVARGNAEALALAGRARFVCGDWIGAIGGLFDAIVCNPPYVPDAEWRRLPPAIGRFEPRAALVGGVDGLDSYRRLLPGLGRVMSAGGAAVLEIGATQADPVRMIATAAGLAAVDVRADLAGRPRCVVLRAVGDGEKNTWNGRSALLVSGGGD